MGKFLEENAEKRMKESKNREELESRRREKERTNEIRRQEEQRAEDARRFQLQFDALKSELHQQTLNQQESQSRRDAAFLSVLQGISASISALSDNINNNNNGGGGGGAEN